jgi:hypothetical protein
MRGLGTLKKLSRVGTTVHPRAVIYGVLRLFCATLGLITVSPSPLTAETLHQLPSGSSPCGSRKPGVTKQPFKSLKSFKSFEGINIPKNPKKGLKTTLTTLFTETAPHDELYDSEDAKEALSGALEVFEIVTRLFRELTGQEPF